MNRLDSQSPIYTGPLHLAAMAMDDAQGHLRDYAGATDDPEPDAAEAAHRVDAIMALLARIERKVDLMPEGISRHSAAPLYGNSSAIGGSDGSR
ncbi:hypothetical protein ISP17_17090 [Dyella ginsengisoli]|uniref:Uncharacterized protein n=1 Tax=Dyella ginsengisoli TaxID=363848 RepID=A0ABW8K0Z3_9GAMM